jgi:hypothetical protein
VIVRLHPHARVRAAERGATETEIIEAIRSGERFIGRLGRSGFRRNFAFAGGWRGKRYATKQLEVYAVLENDEWLVITVLVKFF